MGEGLEDFLKKNKNVQDRILPKNIYNRVNSRLKTTKTSSASTLINDPASLQNEQNPLLVFSKNLKLYGKQGFAEVTHLMVDGGRGFKPIIHPFFFRYYSVLQLYGLPKPGRTQLRFQANHAITQTTMIQIWVILPEHYEKLRC